MIKTIIFWPQFIPNSNEVEILNVILRAVSVFSLPRDQGAPGSGEPTGTPGSGGPTGSPGSGGPTGLPETGKPQDPHKPHKGPILPDPLPFGETRNIRIIARWLNESCSSEAIAENSPSQS